jgi:hypothetical protein
LRRFPAALRPLEGYEEPTPCHPAPRLRGGAGVRLHERRIVLTTTTCEKGLTPTGALTMSVPEDAYAPLRFPAA